MVGRYIFPLCFNLSGARLNDGSPLRPADVNAISPALHDLVVKLAISL